MLEWTKKMDTNPLFLIVHLINVFIAFGTSVIQTKRIIKNSRYSVAIAMIPMVLGLIVASIGTLVIMKQVKTGGKLIKDTNRLIHQIERK